MIEKFTALAANSFMKIYKSKFKKEKSGWANHTAFYVVGGHGLEQFELALEELGGDVFCDHTLMLFFGHSLQRLVAPLARLGVHIGHPLAVAVLDTDEPLTPKARVGDVEIKTAFVRDFDSPDRSGEDVMVRTMLASKPIESAHDFVRDGWEPGFPQLCFECCLECLILCKTHEILLSFLCWNVLSATTLAADYRQTIIPIMLKLNIPYHKSQEAASGASWECLKNFSFLLLTESGISFCPENSVRFGRRAARNAPRGIDFSYVVPKEGVEPSSSREQQILSPSCFPISPLRLVPGTRGRS